MIKTVKEFINDHIKIFREFMIKKANNENIDNYVSDFGNILKEILQAHKNEIAKKDKEIELMNEQCDGAIRKILEQQLFKEDFDEYCQYVNGRREDTYIIKDKSLYNKLPSKEDI